jgi:hypothetical protein
VALKSARTFAEIEGCIECAKSSFMPLKIENSHRVSFSFTLLRTREPSHGALELQRGALELACEPLKWCLNTSLYSIQQLFTRCRTYARDEGQVTKT